VAIDYKATSEATRQALVQAGLTPHQAAIYEALIQHGPQKATRLAFLAGVPRTLSYRVLTELEAEDLVTKKDEPGRVSVFAPAHPLELRKLAERRIEEAKAAQSLMEEALPDLIRGFDDILGALPESELYARVALYAGRASLGPLSLSERSSMQKALADLLEKLSR
jgi:DNA-binding MarR family transcriptional regulator